MRASVIAIVAMLMVAVDGKRKIRNDCLKFLPVKDTQPVCGSDGRVYSSYHELERFKCLTGREDMHEVLFSYCGHRTSMEPDSSILKPVEPDETLFPRHFRTEGIASRFYLYNPSGQFDPYDSYENQYIPNIKTQLQKGIRDLDEVRSDDYKRFINQAKNSRGSDSLISSHVLSEHTLLEPNHHDGKYYVRKQVPPHLPNPEIELRPDDFAHQQYSGSHRSREFFQTSALQTQSQSHPYLVYGKQHQKTEYPLFGSQQTHEYPGSYFATPRHETGESKLHLEQPLNIMGSSYSVPEHERTGYSQSLHSLPIHNMYYKPPFYNFNQEQQQLSEPIQQETEYHDFFMEQVHKEQQQAILHPYYEQKTQSLQHPNQTPFIYQIISTQESPTNIPIGVNESMDEKTIKHLANVQNSLRNQQSIYSYDQQKVHQEHMLKQSPSLYNPIGTQVFTVKLPVERNKTENEKQISVNNIKNPITDQMGNVIGKVDVNVVKIPHKTEIEIEKLLKNLTDISQISYTNKSSISHPIYNTTVQSNIKTTDKLSTIKKSFNQKQVTTKPTSRKPNNQNSKGQKPTTQKRSAHVPFTHKLLTQHRSGISESEIEVEMKSSNTNSDELKSGSEKTTELNKMSKDNLTNGNQTEFTFTSNSNKSTSQSPAE